MKICVLSEPALISVEISPPLHFQVIICTDGLANKGVGNLDGKFSIFRFSSGVCLHKNFPLPRSDSYNSISDHF